MNPFLIIPFHHLNQVIHNKINNRLAAEEPRWLTHNIINLSETENLVTVMWANEQFDPNHSDTFFEPV